METWQEGGIPSRCWGFLKKPLLQGVLIRWEPQVGGGMWQEMGACRQNKLHNFLLRILKVLKVMGSHYRIFIRQVWTLFCRHLGARLKAKVFDLNLYKYA